MSKRDEARLSALKRKAQIRGDLCCSQLMSAFDIKLSKDNYLKIIYILADYRKLLRKLSNSPSTCTKVK